MKNKNNKESKNILSITQIKISLPNKEIKLSSDEARKVYEELGKLFKKEKSPDSLPEWTKDLNDKMLDKILKQKEYIPYPIYIDRPAPLDPYYQPWKLPEIWCESTSQTNFGAPETSILSINLTNNTQ